MLDWLKDRTWLRFTYDNDYRCFTFYHGKHGLITWCTLGLHNNDHYMHQGKLNYWKLYTDLDLQDGSFWFCWLGFEATLY